MDLSADALYRNYLLNYGDIAAAAVQGNIKAGMAGSVIDSVDFSDVDIAQFMEKRAQGDGVDVGDVFKGMRRVRLSGAIFAANRALLYDEMFKLRAALDPVLAQADEPADHGYQPLYFSVPTALTDDSVVTNSQDKTIGFPSGRRFLRALCMPRALQLVEERDMLGDQVTDAGFPSSVRWNIGMMMRDPRIMSELPQLYDIAHAPGTFGGVLVNRGNYYTPLNMVFETNATAGSLVVHIGTTIFTLTVPASGVNRVFRYKGDQRVLTVQDAGGLEVPRMDLLTSSQFNMWADVPPGTTAEWSITLTGTTLQADSEFHYWETYA